MVLELLGVRGVSRGAPQLGQSHERAEPGLQAVDRIGWLHAGQLSVLGERPRDGRLAVARFCEAPPVVEHVDGREGARERGERIRRRDASLLGGAAARRPRWGIERA